MDGTSLKSGPDDQVGSRRVIADSHDIPQPSGAVAVAPRATYSWVGKDQEVARAPGRELLFCITVYNESFEQIQSTVESILRSCEHARDAWLLQGSPAFYILIDGTAQLSPSMRAAAISRGWFDERADDRSDEDGIHVFTSFDAQISVVGATTWTAAELNVLVKPGNKGKLDSHWWFFTKFCVARGPRYCFQVDAGTIVEEAAVYALLGSFRRDADVAAVASDVTIDTTQCFSLIESYQCGDFVIQKTILWPAEHYCGYQSVIPGQFCAVKWGSLTAHEDASADSPLTRYLRGTQRRSAYDTIMFLAEDRVMGAELLFNQGRRNRLTYEPDARCTTDACSTVAELLKQRRRWINSALLCRHWTIGRYAKEIRANEIDLGRLASYVASLALMVWVHILDLVQFLQAAMTLLLTRKALAELAEHFDMPAQLPTSAMVVIASLWFAPSALALSGRLQKMARIHVEATLYLSAVGTVLIWLVNAMAVFFHPGVFGLVVVLMPIYLAALVLVGAVAIGGGIVRIAFRTALQFFLVAVPMNVMLYAYAFRNMGDSSWGTKGLDADPNTRTSDQTVLRAQLRLFGSRFFWSWILATGSLLAAMLYFDLLTAAATVLTVGFLTYFTIGIVGLLKTLRDYRPSVRERGQRALSFTRLS